MLLVHLHIKFSYSRAVKCIIYVQKLLGFTYLRFEYIWYGWDRRLS